MFHIFSVFNQIHLPAEYHAVKYIMSLIMYKKKYIKFETIHLQNQ